MLRPHLASFDGLSFAHLCCVDHSIHKETKDPHTSETERNDDDKKGTEPWNSEKNLQFIIPPIPQKHFYTIRFLQNDRVNH